MGKPIDYFDAQSLQSDLKGKTVRGAAFTGIGQAIRLATQLISIPILARLLTREDFGLVAMVTVFTGFAAMFVEAGLSMATVQREGITHRQVSNLFWLAAALGTLLALLVSALSPLIAWFYGEPRLVWITLALATSFVTSGLTVQHQALLRRTMQFKKLAMIQIVAMLVAYGAAIFWAWKFHTYWALVIAPVTMALMRMIGTWSMCHWRPGLPSRGAGVRPMVAFGANLTGFNFVNYFARNADNAMIGYAWGADELGSYNLAYRLLMMPLQQITAPLTAVAIPALSRLLSEPQKYRSFYKRGILIVTSLGMPLVCLIFCTVDHLVPAFLGPGWGHVVPVFRALTPAAFLGTFSIATGWVYVSTGNTDRQFRLSLITVPFIVLCMGIGLPWGSVGVAAGLSVAWTIVRLPIIIYCYWGTPVTLSDLWEAVCRPAIAALVATAVTVGRSYWLDSGGGDVAEIALDALCFSIAYISMWLFQPNGLAELRKTTELARSFRRGVPQK